MTDDAIASSKLQDLPSRTTVGELKGPLPEESARKWRGTVRGEVREVVVKRAHNWVDVLIRSRKHLASVRLYCSHSSLSAE